eukprot:CAMPEP_0116846868 /NCGR_PEP_ID=MMETSP0418-20121206/14101_1 /TAXON_ID=1158023 /ORGANISM="Astrosyne radiata, Strain 13vi08-1A" /LENGTH=131 /DNA_ID=CAMNT_0004478217 /DNA_START=16 /DNA_END=411 /DNA_ORIENTATION=+
MAAALGSTTIASSSSSNGDETTQYTPPPITTKSSKRALELSRRLNALDAHMYGAYWCTHCFDQKQAFGKEAFSAIRYVECAKDGANTQSSLCKEKEVPGYPTWEIGGDLFPGERELDELEDVVTDMEQKQQ